MSRAVPGSQAHELLGPRVESAENGSKTNQKKEKSLNISILVFLFRLKTSKNFFPARLHPPPP